MSVVPAQPAWVVSAACADGRADPDAFFDPAREREALAVCAACPVQADCLDYAIVAHMDAGVWGGTTERQRAELLRAARKARRTA